MDMRHDNETYTYYPVIEGNRWESDPSTSPTPIDIQSQMEGDKMWEEGMSPGGTWDAPPSDDGAADQIGDPREKRGHRDIAPGTR